MTTYTAAQLRSLMPNAALLDRTTRWKLFYYGITNADHPRRIPVVLNSTAGVSHHLQEFRTDSTIVNNSPEIVNFNQRLVGVNVGT